MKTQTLVICDKCDKPIKPRTGFIVQGNIYIINKDLNERGGLVGNAFPEASEDGTIMAHEIKEVAYHAECLYEILNPTLLMGTEVADGEIFEPYDEPVDIYDEVHHEKILPTQ